MTPFSFLFGAHRHYEQKASFCEKGSPIGWFEGFKYEKQSPVNREILIRDEES